MIFYAYFFCCLSQNNYLCTLIFSLLLNMQSHPTWVRGLKLWHCPKNQRLEESHPTWVRGLKRLIFLESKTFYTLTIYPNTSKFTKSNYSKACCLHSCSSNVLN